MAAQVSRSPSVLTAPGANSWRVFPSKGIVSTKLQLGFKRNCKLPSRLVIMDYTTYSS